MNNLRLRIELREYVKKVCKNCGRRKTCIWYRQDTLTIEEFVKRKNMNGTRWYEELKERECHEKTI